MELPIKPVNLMFPMATATGDIIRSNVSCLLTSILRFPPPLELLEPIMIMIRANIWRNELGSYVGFIHKVTELIRSSKIQELDSLKLLNESLWALVWSLIGSIAIVKETRTDVEKIRKRIDELRRKAPECFTVGDEELPPASPASEALREWALAKLGLRE